MSKLSKLVISVLSGRQDNSIRFNELVSLLLAMGFDQRIKGSHHIFFKPDIQDILNIQPNGSQAKAYQVKQVRDLILKYNLEVSDE